MRVVVLEDYLNYAATSACIEPLKKLGEVICYKEPAQSEAESSMPNSKVHIALAS